MRLFCRLARQHWLQSAVEERVGTVQKQLDLGEKCYALPNKKSIIYTRPPILLRC